MDAAAEAMSIWLNALPENETTSRFKAVQHRAISFGKQNVEAALAFASELMNAEDFQGLLGKQSRYVQTQLHNYDLQAQELGRLLVGTANFQPSA
jgi:phasin protein